MGLAESVSVISWFASVAENECVNTTPPIEISEAGKGF